MVDAMIARTALGQRAGFTIEQTATPTSGGRKSGSAATLRNIASRNVAAAPHVALKNASVIVTSTCRASTG